MNGLIKDIIHAHESEMKAALCTIVNTMGSTPRKTGAKMIVYENGDVMHSIGGGAVEKKVIENAIKQLEIDKAKLFKHDLLKEHSMCCGGRIDVFIEPIMKKKSLCILGAGHIGRALAKMAVEVGFEVYLIDDRQDQLDILNSDGVIKKRAEYSAFLKTLPFNENLYVVVMTYDHAIDKEIIAFCLKKPLAYLGMIGSLRKVLKIKKMFIESGESTELELSNVDMPMGIDIHAESPEEIAISIMAKLIQVKNKVQTK